MQLINTKAGVVEAQIKGWGSTVLVLHGSPGGIDAAIAMSHFLPQANFRTICLSRPGYLGTPLDANKRSIDDEADLLAALLDAVNVYRVGVLAWSGGGPVAYRLAIRHPTRVSTIVAIAAVSHRYVVPELSISERLVFGTALGEHLVGYLTKKVPKHIIKGALENEGTLRGEGLDQLVEQVMADPEQSRLILTIAPTVNYGGKRAVGWENDKANFANLDSLELERVTCPVLLVQGDGDTDVVPECSRFAHATLPNSALIEMKDGTHLSFYCHAEASEVQEKTRRWFDSYQATHS